MTLEPERLARLVEFGRTLVAELDLDALLQRILEIARELTGARYAALGILDRDRTELQRFLFSGVAEERVAAIGEAPRGRGVLGVLTSDPRPLRLDDVSAHPRSYGFPHRHPPMKTFLGVPVLVGGVAYGNLYLAEKRGGRFSPEDEEALVVLADWAAIAIDNARRHRQVRGRRDELERALRGFDAATELARAVGGQTDLEAVLDLVVKRSRALLEARTAVLVRLEGEHAVAAAAAGADRAVAVGRRVAVDRRLTGYAVDSGRTTELQELPTESLAHQLGARAAVWAPLRFRGETLGAIVVYGDHLFTAEDERLLTAFAASAASAVATAQNAASHALRLSIEAAETERKRWARELHDQTLQELGALRMLLSSARRADAPTLAGAVDDAVELLGEAIAELRMLITELRPAALDQLGTGPALEALVDRARRLSGLEIELTLDLAYETGRAPERHVPELESTVYRIVQEALTNIARHAGATAVAVAVVEDDSCVCVEVRDDGHGFSTDGTERGFGLVGMNERAALAGGTVRVESVRGTGTRVRAELPVRRRASVAGRADRG